MKNLPYFRWYPADAETDELYSSLTDSELGFFHRCLNKAWINRGLPGDMHSLSTLMRVPQTDLEATWARVGKLFYVGDGGRFFNRRQEEERTHAITKGEKNKRVGNANASRGKRERVFDANETRSDRDSNAFENERVENANAPQHARARADSVSVSKEVIPFNAKISFEQDRDAAWEWFSATYPGQVNEDWDCQVFTSVIQTFEDIRDLRTNLPLWKQSETWQKGFPHGAENFLRKGIFKTKPKARDSPASSYGTTIKYKTLAESEAEADRYREENRQRILREHPEYADIEDRPIAE